LIGWLEDNQINYKLEVDKKKQCLTDRATAGGLEI
jgi:hypothetical protein